MNFSPTTHAHMHIWRTVLRALVRQAGSIAILFWGGWLALAAFESSIGSNLVVSVLFSLSLPLLVGLLTWTSRSFIWVIQQRFLAITIMGLTVLILSSLITAVGMAAMASLKTMLGNL